MICRQTSRSGPSLRCVNLCHQVAFPALQNVPAALQKVRAGVCFELRFLLLGQQRINHLRELTGSREVAVVPNGLVHEECILGHLGSLEDQRGVGGGVARGVLLEGGEIPRVCHHRGELLQLDELRACVGGYHGQGGVLRRAGDVTG